MPLALFQFLFRAFTKENISTPTNRCPRRRSVGNSPVTRFHYHPKLHQRALEAQPPPSPTGTGRRGEWLLSRKSRGTSCAPPPPIPAPAASQQASLCGQATPPISPDASKAPGGTTLTCTIWKKSPTVDQQAGLLHSDHSTPSHRSIRGHLRQRLHLHPFEEKGSLRHRHYLQQLQKETSNYPNPILNKRQHKNTFNKIKSKYGTTRT